MKLFKKKEGSKLSLGISKINPLIRLWAFGSFLLIFSLFAEIKLVPAVLLFMVVVTIIQHRAKKINTRKDIQEIHILLEEYDEEIAIAEEQVNGPSVTLEDRLIHKDLLQGKEDLLIELEEKEEIKEKIDKIDKNIKNFLVKLKKPGKLLTASKKERKSE